MNAQQAIDFQGLAALVRSRRGNRSLRDVAKECRVSPSTLSRIERGEARPDLDTIKLLLDWVGVPIDRVLVEAGTRERTRRAPRQAGSTLDAVEIQFRADPNLPPEAAETLIRIVREAYRGLAGGKAK